MPIPNPRGSLIDILNSEYDSSIDERRKKMVLQSYYKYGPSKKNFGEGRVDALASAKLCIDKFERTKNAEYLMDAMNYLMFRIKYPIPGDYFEYTSSGESAGTVGTPINLER